MELTKEEVNLLTKLTIKGHFGNGRTREKILGEFYSVVQEQVNSNLLKGNKNWEDITYISSKKTKEN